MKKGSIIISRFLIVCIFVFFIVALHYGFYFVLINSGTLSLKHVIIQNNKFVSSETIINITGLREGMSILKLDLTEISKTLKSHPFIEDAEVKRVLPDKIEIILKERDIVANLLYQNNSYLIDKNGVVLTNGYYPAIPILEVDYTISFEKNTMSDEFIKFNLKNIFEYGNLDKIERIIIKKESGIYIYLKKPQNVCFFAGKKILDSEALDKIFFLSENIITENVKLNFVDIRKENAIGK